MKTLRLGIIGTGRIAKRFVTDTKMVSDVQIVCVYNPRETSAKKFAQEHGLDQWFCNYDKFLSMVDAVYIASPHETHFDYAKRILEEGKHVLCEKPMCLKKQQAEELYQLARQQSVILREAIKTSYFSGFQKIIEVANSGQIGEIRDVEACFTKITDKDGRELSDTLYGGSVTELASYVLLPIFRLLGTDYKELSFQSILADHGVDAYTKIILGYEHAMALGKVGLGVKSEGQLIIAGTKGYILCESPWWLTKHFQVRDVEGNTLEEYSAQLEGSGLQYELASFVAEIEDREIDASAGINREESIAIANVIETFLERRNSSTQN